MIRRFTVYRRRLSERGTHTKDQANDDLDPQFEGALFTDGTVTLRWLTPCKSTSCWANLEEMLKVHGHPEYGTEIHWHDWSIPPSLWTRMVADADMSETEKLSTLGIEFTAPRC